ncbi:MAG: MATE family efflux transporter [Rikenellaceae bacterium]
MSKIELRDEIDFNNDSIPKLFRSILIPTLLGMSFTALFIIADGIFVGRGIGGDALAAVNIVAPFYSIAVSVGLMLGMGASILASIHLVNRKPKVARIVVTQAAFTAIISMLIISALSLIFLEELLMAVGATPDLLPLAKEYASCMLPFLIMGVTFSCVPFFIRLDGAASYAMWCSIIGSSLNIVLDYLFIFVFEWGLTGAAIATSIGNTVGAVGAFAYLLNKSHNLHFEKVKFSIKSILMTLRNIWYMSKLGGATFISQLSVVIMMVCGNLVFVRDFGVDGVAAFSVCCYVFPLVSMMYVAISQSAQPIISSNFAGNLTGRVHESFRIALIYSIVIGAALVLGMTLLAPAVVGLFLEKGTYASDLAIHGASLFSIGFIPFAINMVVIGYLQSTKEVSNSMVVMMLRGVVFMLLAFYIVPMIWSTDGGWLAVPVAETATLICLLLFFRKKFLR